MSNNKQQTAVEWFWNQLPEILPFTVDTETAVKLQEAYQQAKEMEKEEITLAHIYAAIFTEWDENTDARKNADQYYEQTYGGGEQ